MNLYQKVINNQGAIKLRFGVHIAPTNAKQFSSRAVKKHLPIIWKAYGKKRLYIPQPKSLLYQAGYIDLITGEIHPEKEEYANYLNEVIEYIKNLSDVT